MKKRIAKTIIMSLVLATLFSITALAGDVSREDNSKDEIILKDLVDENGNVYGTLYITPAGYEEPGNRGADHTCPNFAKSHEQMLISYVGELEFRAAHRTNSTCGSGLKANLNVRQGGIDFRRNGNSVIGGWKYTSTASSKSDNTLRRISALAYDDIFAVGSGATTSFYRTWLYF
jgi:hypothetical protein